MAIIIEEEKSRASLVPILIWGVVVAIVIAAIYYLFFKRPELIPLPTPPSLVGIDKLVDIPFDPQEVTQNPAFQVLRQYVPLPSSTPSAGRPNPFLPF